MRIALLFLLLVLTAPLAGIVAAGGSISLFASFPPLTSPAEHAPFSWSVFLLLLLFALAVFTLLLRASRSRCTAPGEAADNRRLFPWWGWAGLALILLFWPLAWTRLAIFAPLQRHTFTPLWLGYILTVNGLCRLRHGSAPLAERPLLFLLLFPLSSLFWWVFEYLNQFVDNWYYRGVDYGPLAYSLHASISFATVLPAVYSTRELLRRSAWFRTRFCGLPPLSVPASRLGPWLLLILSWLGLALVPIRPEECYPLLWLAPLLLLVSLLHLCGRRSLFSPLFEGDWRPAISAALAALICGFFWEMWNFYSLAKWVYAIPYVQRFHLFEMPLPGYMGYLPFGLLCVEVVEQLRTNFSRLR